MRCDIGHKYSTGGCGRESCSESVELCFSARIIYRDTQREIVKEIEVDGTGANRVEFFHFVFFFFYSSSRQLSFQSLYFFLHGLGTDVPRGQQLASDDHLPVFEGNISVDDLPRSVMYTLCNSQMIAVLKTQTFQQFTDTLYIIPPVFRRALTSSQDMRAVG